MKILEFSYKDTFQEWEIEKINFFNLTLLVGVSGVGKTQILQAINSLKNIANGSSMNGVEWDILFSTNDGSKYRWKGAFKLTKPSEEISEQVESFINTIIPHNILNEQLFFNDTLIWERNTDGTILFEGHIMPKLSTNESCLHILKEEDKIKPAYESFKIILFRDYTQKENLQLSSYNNEYKKLNSLASIRKSNLTTLEKLARIYEKVIASFNEIKNSFIDVFPQVVDIKIDYLKNKEKHSFLKVKGTPFLSIKEKGVNKWIPQHHISSGMLRTLLHISEMFLCGDGTVILIDEFENSLGLNCINVLTHDLVLENNRIQFIATSHHPYIINKIPYNYWKIVTRKGGLIQTHDAKEFNLDEDSHHERFMNLINLPQYRTGIL